MNVKIPRGGTLAIKYFILITLCIMVMSPIATALLGSVRVTGDFLLRPFGLPEGEWQWQHYTEILLSHTFWRSMLNSLIITVSTVVLNVSLACMLAFSFTKLSFRGRKTVFNILSIGLMFPITVAILPIFTQIKQLDWIDSYWGVIFPLVAFGLPQSTIILRSFFIAVPNELADASYVDGCTTFGFFRYILIPMARPAITAVVVIQIIISWNEYFLPLLILNDDDLWTLPLGIMQFQAQFGTDWSRVMAYVTLLIIPAVVFYVLTEKYIVTGLIGGELKG
ncbi:MAG: carbohydrate ABC transporter permease [Phototrophicales bacterium]|nr:carbohydrate ABC transporter permease [Phototrophicales bacterium]